MLYIGTPEKICEEKGTENIIAKFDQNYIRLLSEMLDNAAKAKEAHYRADLSCEDEKQELDDAMNEIHAEEFFDAARELRKLIR